MASVFFFFRDPGLSLCFLCLFPSSRRGLHRVELSLYQPGTWIWGMFSEHWDQRGREGRNVHIRPPEGVCAVCRADRAEFFWRALFLCLKISAFTHLIIFPLQLSHKPTINTSSKPCVSCLSDAPQKLVFTWAEKKQWGCSLIPQNPPESLPLMHRTNGVGTEPHLFRDDSEF